MICEADVLLSLGKSNKTEVHLLPQDSDDQRPDNTLSILRGFHIYSDTRLTGPMKSRLNEVERTPMQNRLTIEAVNLRDLPALVIAP